MPSTSLWAEQAWPGPWREHRCSGSSSGTCACVEVVLDFTWSGIFKIHYLFGFIRSSLHCAGPFKKFIYFNWRLITLQYCGGFCHTLTWISHGCTCVPHPESPSHLPPHLVPLGCPSVPALSILSHASNLDWWSVSHMKTYMFQCYSLRSSTLTFSQCLKDYSIHLCLFYFLAYRVIITIFLNSICMH